MDLLLRARKDHTYLVASPTYTKLEDETLATTVKLAKELGVYLLLKGSPPNLHLTTGATIRFRSASEPHKLAGPNLSGVWMDEAGQMEELAYVTVIGCLREGGQQGWLSVTSTPKGKHHWLYRVFGTGRKDTADFRSRTSDNPFLPPNFERTLTQQYPQELVAQELLGEWVDEDDGRQVIPSLWVELAQARWREPDRPLDAVGVDVGGGKDATVYAPRHDKTIGTLDVCYGNTVYDGPSAVTRLIQNLKGSDSALVVIDSTGGWGGSLYDHAKQLLTNPLMSAVMSARSDMLDQHGHFGFQNLRAQAYWNLRECLDPEGSVRLSLPPDDELAAELTAHKYKMGLSGVLLDPKDDVKELLGRSPDRSDAVALACLIP